MLLAIIALNSRQSYRPILLVGIIFCAHRSFREISDAQLGFWCSDTLALFIIIYASHISCVLCYEKHVLPQRPGLAFDWVGGYKMLFNARWLGTNRQAPYIKVAIKRKTEDDLKPQGVGFHSPRAVFLLNRILSLAGMLITETAYTYVFLEVAPQYGLQMNITDFLPTKQSYFRRLGEVTLRETAIRAWLVPVFIFQSVSTYLTIHDILAFIFVATGFDDPEDWPPLFGDIRDATSIQSFWGKFWHRLVYRSYTSYGIWISKNALRLPKSSLIGRLFINFFVYTLSGCLHMLAAYQLGYTCGVLEELTFYIYNFLGVLVEMAAVEAFSYATRGYKLNSTVSRLLGYSWVFVFFFTILPKNQFPKAFCEP